jgi:hypothetical protein
MTFNPPRPQNGPVLWGALCLFGLGVAVYVLLKYPVGAESWWVGILLAGTVVAGFVAIAGWWLASQRQVTIHQETVEVRRWSDVLLSRPGHRAAIQHVHSVGLVYQDGKKIRIELSEGSDIIFWAALWPRSEVDGLIQQFQARGISVRADW